MEEIYQLLNRMTLLEAKQQMMEKQLFDLSLSAGKVMELEGKIKEPYNARRNPECDRKESSC